MAHVKADNRRAPPLALTIAGSDSGGGAGIQADLKTFADLGVHGTCAITALTAQNTRGVQGVWPVPPESVAAQIAAVLDDFPIAAIKTGMLADSTIIDTVIAALAAHGQTPLVVDPVMVASSGDQLLQDSAVAVLKSQLVPMATVLTPNIPEAEVLLGAAISTREHMREAAHALLALGCQAVILKGGHLHGAEVTDLLVSAQQIIERSHPRVQVQAHGTGCTLAAATAAGLALGLPLEQSFCRASDYVARVLSAGFATGSSAMTVLAHGIRDRLTDS